MQRTALELPDSTGQKGRLVERDDPLLHVERVEHPSIAGYSQQTFGPGQPLAARARWRRAFTPWMSAIGFSRSGGATLWHAPGQWRAAAGLGHMQPAATQIPNGLVLDVRHAVAQLWASSADTVKAACGPHVPTGLVDEIDVLSWLTADVLGRPLLHADDTNAVGKRIAAHASRVEKRLRVETESTRNTVGKARVVAAKKSPSCCPRWPQLKRRAKRHVPCCSRSRTTRSCQPRPSSVGEKRQASHWRQREVDETCAKVSSVGHGGR